VSVGVNGINPPSLSSKAGEFHSPLRIIFWLTLVASAILLAPTIFWPFDYDQGTFAYGGWAVLHGQRPYIDFWDIKPPNIFYTYAAAFALFGNSVRAIRIFDYLNALLTIGLLFVLATRLWKDAPWRNLAAVMASLAFVVQYYIFGHWDTAQTETYSLPLLIGAMLLVIPRKESVLLHPAIRSICAGALIGIAFYFKFPNALFLALIATAIWFYSPKEIRIKSIFWLSAGFIAAVGLESLYLALNGELLPLWQLTTSETTSYVSSNYSGSFGFLQNLRTSVQALDLSWTIIGIIGWSYWAIARRHEEKDSSAIFRSFMLVLLGCLIAFVAVQLQNKGYKYHYAILLPWADVLIGAGFTHVVCAFSNFIRLPRWSIATVTALALFAATFWGTSFFPLQNRVKELIGIANGSEPANGYIATDSLSNYVIQHTQPSDKIFIFGFQPYVYWKTGRAPATKFLNTIHFKPNTVNKAERDELVTSLLRNPPELFLVEMGDRYTSQGNTNDDSRTTILLRYPELEQLLLHSYWPQDTLQNTIIYHKR
jgi:4-amino-4-deoxy-L-arabinose transferase-like glycosyltransferase